MDASSLLSFMQYAPTPGKTLRLLPEVAGYAYGLLTDPRGTAQAFSDKYLGTHFGQSAMMQEQGNINSQLANDERFWQERMLAEDRVYNSPSNQMALLRQAGLNPALMYGQMSDISGNAPSAGAASVGLGSPQYGAVTPSSLLSAQVANLDAASALSASQAYKNDIEADIMQKKLPEELRNLQEQNKVLSAQVSELNKKIEVYSAQISNLNFDGQLKVAQAAKNYFDMNLASATFERDSNKVLAEINYLRSLSNEADSRTELNKRNLYELRETWSYRLLGFDLDNQRVVSEIGLNRAKVVESNFVAQQIGLDIQAGRLHAVINQSLYDTSFGGKGSKLERGINRALLTITDYFGKSALSIGNGLQSAGALKMLMK